MTYVPSIHYSFIIDILLLYQKWKKLGMVTDVFGLYLYEKNVIVERFSLISASEERLEKIFCFKICLLHTEIFSKRRKIYSWMNKRLELTQKLIFEGTLSMKSNKEHQITSEKFCLCQSNIVVTSYQDYFSCIGKNVTILVWTLWSQDLHLDNCIFASRYHVYDTNAICIGTTQLADYK